jgi:hypothetical protein
MLMTKDFWPDMKRDHFAYLLQHPSGKPNKLPKNIPYTDLSTYFSFTPSGKSFGDDCRR